MAATNHFDHFDAFSFLLAIAFLTSLYTAAVGAAALCKLCASSKYWGTSMLFWQLCGDYIFMMLLFAASCAGAASTTQASKGKISYCDSVGHNFCAKDAGQEHPLEGILASNLDPFHGYASPLCILPDSLRTGYGS
eukprot:SM000033S12359  [mRNA]  locus=s33:430847:432590:+ [translate_table: standard]